MSKLVIGLTGGIGSGKSAAADLFADLGVAIVDADIAARKVVEPGQIALNKLVEHFGPDILVSESNPTLNREKLRSLIFANPDERQWLNDLLHPLIKELMDKEVAQATSPYVIKVIPLLAESKLQKQFDRVLVIDVPIETQKSRVMARDTSSQYEIESIIKSQASREERLAIADDVIVNDSSLSVLEIGVKKMHNKYLNLVTS